MQKKVQKICVFRKKAVSLQQILEDLSKTEYFLKNYWDYKRVTMG
jgi:hypothetical protein